MLAIVGTLPGAVVANHGASPPIDHEVTVTPGPASTWAGTIATGANTDYDFATGEECSKSVDTYCDITLLHVDVPATYWDDKGGGVQVTIDTYFPNPASDFDLQVFRRNPDGSKGPQVAPTSGNPAGLAETTTILAASGDYFVQVVYFAVAASNYMGHAEFVLQPKPPATPPDVDVPAGLQDVLASNPALGFRSHSEPHLGQNPVDPNILVAGSKMYNRDPQSLPEYEFKIGTYVSFDGGQKWTDLGQLAVCPAAQAPPSSWPNNTCYPEDDPSADDEFAEEYITSDVWIQFDDEGNAYAMVLDAPPFASTNGWGMTLHKWSSVSPADLQPGGQTWGPRLPINKYEEGLPQQLLLDDKNTFAINNAGPDGDGQTGIMIACWGQNVPDLIKQQVVCKRSTDAGTTWPDTGNRVVSGLEQLVIGAHVVADPNDPMRFYVSWLQYATSTGGAAPATMDFAQTFDGGLTWTPPVQIATVNPVPRQFPGQSFRNLSIPIMAVGPASELYLTWADYQAAPAPGDTDGRQAEIVIVRSTNGGITWQDLGLAPKKVNQDTGNADQFQQYVVVSPAGTVEVIYFDRRHDPSNLFIDTYLSRSNDMGTTFSDVRLSHDLWDPRINPPISSSGDFIGDYQGLVADECFTIPFVNDTHLANDPGRDKDFDKKLPRSQFQEVFSWRVPSGACGGPAVIAKVTGGGQAPGSGSAGTITFGLNARSTGSAASGNVNVYDHQSRQHVRSVTIGQVSRTSATEVVITGTCSIGGGPAAECVVRVVDVATPGAGRDEFHVRVGSAAAPLYEAGGVLARGNIQIHK